MSFGGGLQATVNSSRSKDLLRATVSDKWAFNRAKDLKGRQAQCTVGIARFEFGKERVFQDSFGFGVREQALKSVTDFDPSLAILPVESE
jgi:hypothetical protein